MHPEVAMVVEGLSRRPLSAGAFEHAYEFADRHPDLVLEFVLEALPTLRSGDAFLNDMLSRLPLPDLDHAAATAIAAYRADTSNDAAESAIEHISLQKPQALSEYLPELWLLSAST